MRDRLLKLCKKSQAEWLEKTYDHETEQKLEEYVADYLLERGVIVPPCKVGDRVYVINDCEVEETTIFSMKIETEDSRLVIFLKAIVADHGIKSNDGYGRMFNTFVFGKTVFLTKEEAEAKLKGE